MSLRAGTRVRPQSCRVRAMCGGSAGWNPGDLSGLAATIVVAEQRSGGYLWQNTAKTTPATADGDPVRVAVCPYTAVEFTAPSDAARPLLYDEGGGKWLASFDGVDDCTIGPAITITKTTAFAVGFVVKTSAAVQQSVITDWAVGASPGWEIQLDSAGKVRMLMADDSGSNHFLATSSGSVNDGSPHRVVVTYDGSVSATGVAIWIDGVGQSITPAATGTGDPGTFVNTATRIGVRNSGAGSTFLAGYLSGVVPSIGTLSAGSRALLDSYLTTLY